MTRPLDLLSNESPACIGFTDCECQDEDAYAVRDCRICNGTRVVEIETWPAEEPEPFADCKWPAVVEGG